MGWELHLAAENGDLASVDRLLANGADPNGPNDDEETPLFLASCHGHTDIVRSLLVHGANVNFATESELYTALMIACAQGHNEVVRELLAAGADVNATDDYDATALTRAAGYGYGAIVQMLLTAGADANLGEERAMTALELAEGSGHNEVAALIQPYVYKKSFLRRAVEQIVGRERRGRVS